MTKNSLICALVSFFQTFLYYHAQYNSGSYDLIVFFIRAFIKPVFGAKIVALQFGSVYPIRTKSEEGGQEPITKNIYLDCFQVFSVLGSRLFPVSGSRVFRCTENTSCVP